MATDAQGDVILQETYYSIGGGFVVTEAELAERRGQGPRPAPIPLPVRTAAEMLAWRAKAA
jgi:L-serine dehydratase